MSQRVLPNDVARTALRYFESLGSPFAKSLAVKVREGDWDGLATVSVDPRNYQDATRYALDAFAAGLLQKCQALPTSWDRTAKATEKWQAGETACFWTNERLGKYLPENRLSADRDPRIESFLDSVRKIILQWIGPSPSAYAQGKFGPGATFSDREDATAIPDKIKASDPSLTRDAIWFLPQWLETQWGREFCAHHERVSFVRGNRFAVAPKSAKTHRSIASEPSINMFYQLALGRQLRVRLRNATAWNLDQAKEIHVRVARESSRSLEFATLDLSNASDTVAWTLVKILLPPLWYEALDDLRSKRTLFPKGWRLLEKFSSMGNGYTFELETIIFAALSCAVSRKAGFAGQLGYDVFTFGDDIIVKTAVARPLIAVLGFLGFALNTEKSYYGEEPFRESCGGDFFNGVNVRPYYLKEAPSGPESFIPFANGLRAANDRLALAGCLVDRSAWFSVLDCIPSRIRSCRGPKDLGDLVIHDEQQFWTLRYRGPNRRYLQVFRPFRWRVKRYEQYRPGVVLACATYGCGNRKGGVIPRDGVLGYKVGWKWYS